MTEKLFFGNYLVYPRCIKVAVGEGSSLINMCVYGIQGMTNEEFEALKASARVHGEKDRFLCNESVDKYPNRPALSTAYENAYNSYNPEYHVYLHDNEEFVFDGIYGMPMSVDDIGILFGNLSNNSSVIDVTVDGTYTGNITASSPHDATLTVEGMEYPSYIISRDVESGGDYVWRPGVEFADITIEHENGTSEIVPLRTDKTYGEQGRGGFYRQNTYDSSVEEQLELLVDNNYPVDGETIYDYCTDIYEPEELPSFYETVSIDLSSEKIDENVPDSIPFLVGCLGFVDGWFDTRYGKDLDEAGVINWYTESPVDLGQIYDIGITNGKQHANEPQFRDPYFAVGYIDGYLDYLELDDYHHYLHNKLRLDRTSGEKPGYDEGAVQGLNDHARNAQ